jgi:peptidyl-dipeptidase A
MTRRPALPLALLLALPIVSACSSTVDPDQQKKITTPIQRDGGSMWITESEAKPLVQEIVGQMKEKEKAYNLAWWEATISGKKEDFDKATRLELELRKVFQNKENYKKLKWLTENTPRLKDDLLIREITVLYFEHLKNAIDPKLQEEITKKGAEIEQLFYASRATVDGKPLTANDIREVMGKEKSSAKRQKVWEASKEIGKAVAPKLVELVKLRNQAVKPLGFASYYDFQLKVNEIEPKVLQETLEELTTETEKEWAKVKASVDARLAKRWGVKGGAAAMRPWHYEDVFFQDAPKVVDLGLDKYYAKKNPVEVVTETYRDLELEIKDIVARSDLSEKPGKMQHAYSISIDRLGDVRVLANVRPTAQWYGTLLHEFAHALHDTGYNKYGETQGRELPWLLRQPSNYVTTEAAAMFFEDWVYDVNWYEKYMGVGERDLKRIEKPLKEMLKIKKLAFIRWSMVMVNFERELYRDPTQNLNKLWWDMVEKYQLVKRPEGRDAPDWATKIHFVMAPVYYQNYMLAQVMTAMIKHRFLLDVLRKTNPEAKVFVGRADLGAQFLGAIFMMGAKWHWSQMVTTVCGEVYTTKYFIDAWVKDIDETEKDSPLKDEPAGDGGVKPGEKKDEKAAEPARPDDKKAEPAKPAEKK